MNKREVTINGRSIGVDFPPYVVAELSANHNGSLEYALRTLEAAKAAGADAVKLQTYTPDTMTIDCKEKDFMVEGGLWDGYSLYDLYQWAQTPFEWQKPLFEKARELDVTCFSTPFDESAVELLEDLNAPAYKIASFEAIDLALIKRVSETRKPVIISTGMAGLEEIDEAVDTARSSGCSELILLHCISSYPAPAEQSHLRTLIDLADRYDVVAGLSDHTLGITVSLASAALGASFIEKHFTLDRAQKGPDSTFSIEPSELRDLCAQTKIAWSALGRVNYERKPAEEASLKFRRSLYAVQDIKQGEIIDSTKVRRIRPGYGLAPKHLPAVIGKKARADISRGTAIQWELLDD